MSHAHEVVAHPRVFAIGVGLNLAFVVVEVVFGILSGSMALVTDAAHNVSDVLGLSLAWFAITVARRRPTRSHTYGLRRSTILAALANALLLLVAVGGIGVEALRRILEPQPVEGGIMMAVAAVGVVVNGGSALLFMRGSRDDLNVRGAFLHLAADAAVSVGVIVAGAAVLWTGRTWIDPVVGLAISGVIVTGTWSLLRRALNLAMDAVPEHIDMEALELWLAGRPGVVNVHDLHVWALSTTETALTAHLRICEPLTPSFLADTLKGLERSFRIHHATLQVESCECESPCSLG